MSTINAQSIINEVMQAHAVAPSKYTWGDYITFKTSERGSHRIRNCKENLQRFADAVRKNAAAFGGGLIREAKEKITVSYPSKTISLYKQLIEDQDWYAALQLAEEELAPMFFFGTDGKAHIRVAPIPLEAEPRLVSCMNDDGKWTVIEPRTMVSLPSRTRKNARSRDAQVSDVLDVLNSHTDVRRAEWFKNVASMETTDQATARAQWMADHGMVDDAAIEARIEAQAAQDVAEVVAQAVAVSAIAEAMAPAAETESTPELVTCEAGESESQKTSTGNASGFTVAVYNTVTSILASFTPTMPPSGENAVDTTIPAETEYEDRPCVGPFDIPACISVYDHAGYLVSSEDPDAPKIIDRLARLSPQEPAQKPDDHANFNIRAKSGAWFACVYMMGTVYGLRFEAKGMEPITGEFATHQERMQALEMMANAMNTPPDGGMPIEPIEAPTPTVAECTPDTPSAVSSTNDAPLHPRNIVPTNGVHIVDDAFEAWKYQSGSRFGFVMYLGKSAKPWKYYGYKTAEARDTGMKYWAKEARDIAEFKAQRKAEDKAKAEQGHGLEVGDVVRSSWGYDQTNVNHYQIMKLIGKRTVEVRELAEHQDATGHMTGQVAPVWGEFIGEPMRRTVDRHGNVNILREKFGRASKIEPVAVVHGVRCYASTGYSSYA